MSSNPTQFAETAGAPTTVLDRAEKPKGVISKRAQQYVFAGIAVVIVLVAMFLRASCFRPLSPSVRMSELRLMTLAKQEQHQSKPLLCEV